MMRRRMAQMNARMNPGGMSASSSGGKPGPASAAPPHPPMSSGSTMNHMNNSGKPGGSGQPNQNVLEAVKKVSINILILNHLTGGVLPGAGGSQAAVPTNGPEGSCGRSGGEGWSAESAKHGDHQPEPECWAAADRPNRSTAAAATTNGSARPAMAREPDEAWHGA